MKLKAIPDQAAPPQAPASPVGSDELLPQISKITQSSSFSSSDILKNLLFFLATAAIERPGESIREQEIAENVLGRTDFDARIDSGVRVHAGRLRSKLAEYYLGDGASDNLIVEISKGSYQLAWRYRTALQVLPPDSPSTSQDRRNGWKSWPVRYLAAAALVIIGLSSSGLTAWWIHRQHSERIPSEVQEFWTPFLYGERPPIVVFGGPRAQTGPSNNSLGTPEDDLMFSTSWAGVGALFSVHRLTSIFTELDRSFILKRSLKLNWDDARRETLILIGGPDSNTAHASLPKTKRFVFPLHALQEKKLGIEDLNAKNNQSRYYTSEGSPLHLDHALIAYLPTRTPEHPMLIAAGGTTFGTQAAVEFITEKESLKNLRTQLQVKDGKFPYFEALIKVNVRDGVPIHSELIAVHQW